MTSEQLDAEANAFAMELLMPSEWLLRDLKGVDLFDEAKLAKIAKRYRVPVSLMMLHYGEIIR